MDKALYKYTSIKEFIETYNDFFTIRYYNKENRANVYLDIINYVIKNANKITKSKERKLEYLDETIGLYVDIKTYKWNKMKFMKFEPEISSLYENSRIRLEQIFFEVMLKDEWKKFVKDNKKQGISLDECKQRAEKIYDKIFVFLRIVKENTKDYTDLEVKREPDVIGKIRRIAFEIITNSNKKFIGQKMTKLEGIAQILDEYFEYKFPYFQLKKPLPNDLKMSIDNVYIALKQKDEDKNDEMALKEKVNEIWRHDLVEEKYYEELAKMRETKKQQRELIDFLNDIK